MTHDTKAVGNVVSFLLVVVLALVGACSDPSVPASDAPELGSPGSDVTEPFPDAGVGFTADTTVRADPETTVGVDVVADVGKAGPPAYFEVPCSTNDQCVDKEHEDDPYGYCIQIDKDGDKQCTTPCVSDCPEGYGCVGIQNPGGSDGLFVCMPEQSTNCNECEVNVDCIYEDARCVGVGFVDGEVDMRCAQDCSKTSEEHWRRRIW